MPATRNGPRNNQPNLMLSSKITGLWSTTQTNVNSELHTIQAKHSNDSLGFFTTITNLLTVRKTSVNGLPDRGKASTQLIMKLSASRKQTPCGWRGKNSVATRGITLLHTLDPSLKFVEHFNEVISKCLRTRSALVPVLCWKSSLSLKIKKYWPLHRFSPGFPQRGFWLGPVHV